MSDSKKGKKVVVGMSGGVDSSVAAYLLKEEGYDVIGVTMQIWQDEDEFAQQENAGCCGLSAVWDARRVAQKLDIPYYVMNFKKDFKEKVMDYFVHEYLNGRTPNPCIACNRYVKWESLLRRSIEIGADYIATGHYAKVVRLPSGRFALAQSATLKKDQTYALYNLTQYQLERTLMPLGGYTKDEVRKIARDRGLFVADKKDSQEICFVPDDDYAGFIGREVGEPSPKGYFVTLSGERLGEHKGIIHYTVGQRKGLGLSLGRPAYVVAIRPDANEVVIGGDADVYGDVLYANKLNFMAVGDLDWETDVWAKIRYNHKGAKATIRRLEEDLLECRFDEPQRAITPGQAVVLYRDGVVLGGGTVCIGINS